MRDITRPSNDHSPNLPPIETQVKNPGAAKQNDASRPVFFNHWSNMGAQVNDNAAAVPARRRTIKPFLLAYTLWVGAVLIAFQDTAITTWAVPRMDDRVLSAAMDISPDMVGTALNTMDIGN